MEMNHDQLLGLLQELKEQLVDSHNSKMKLQQRVEELETELAMNDGNATHELVVLQQENKELKEEMKKLSQSLEECHSDYETLMKEKDQSEMRVLALESDSKSKIEELSEMIERQKDLSLASGHESKNLIDEIALLKSAAALRDSEHQAMISKYESMLQEEKARVDELKEMIEKQKDASSTRESEVKNLVEEVAQLKNVAALTDSEHQASIAKYESVLQEEKAKIDELESKSAMQIRQMSEWEAKSQNLAQTLLDSETERDRLNESLDGLKKNASQMEEKIRELESLQEQARTKDDAKSDAEYVREKLEKAENELRMMRRGISPQGWVPHKEIHENPAPPHLSIRSPEIQSILEEWTQDKGNAQFMTNWCSRILSGEELSEKAGFQTGVELTKMSTAARDGFLTIIIPLLLTRPGVEIECHSREIPKILHELRIRVVQKNSSGATPSKVLSPGINAGNSVKGKRTFESAGLFKEDQDADLRSNLSNATNSEASSVGGGDAGTGANNDAKKRFMP